MGLTATKAHLVPALPVLVAADVAPAAGGAAVGASIERAIAVFFISLTAIAAMGLWPATAVAIVLTMALAVLVGLAIRRLEGSAATIATLIALELFMQRQKNEIAMRAAAEEFAVARLIGIRANKVISAAFALSGLLAGVAAVLRVSQRASVDLLIGFTLVLKALIAAILRGLGSLGGDVAGGFLLGVIEVFLAAFPPAQWQAFREPIGLSLVVLVLVVRAKGLIPAAPLKAQKV